MKKLILVEKDRSVSKTMLNPKHTVPGLANIYHLNKLYTQGGHRSSFPINSTFG